MLNRKQLDGRLGFTLIELLIVVAIIAILAAIAVPNFLEAQVRAKISRAYADMRSTAVGLESYAVDHNRYPIGFMNIREGNKVGGPYPDIPQLLRNDYALSALTTPVAFINSVFKDPFTGGNLTFDRMGKVRSEPISYWYDDYRSYPMFSGRPDSFCYTRHKKIHDVGYRWSLSSAGPQRKSMMMWYALDGETPEYSSERLTIAFAYDSTNGTKSEGFIATTSKGVFKEVNQGK